MERTVHEAVSGAASGAGSLLLVERSRPGVLDRAARDAAGQDADVLRARARGGDGACAPFDVARELFGPAVAALGPGEREAILVGAPRLAEPLLTPGGDPQPPPGGEVATIHGFYWLAANLADRRPLVLLVEDAHRADLPSLRLCLYLAQRIEELPVVLVLETAPGAADEPTGPLAALAAQRHARRVTGP